MNLNKNATNVAQFFKSYNRRGKRRQVSLEECLFDLQEDLPKIFSAFKDGVKKYNQISSMISSQAKVRFEASLLNATIIESLQNNFPNNWKWGKYKRFILRLNEHIFLIKKLKANNKPMNVKTKHVNMISNQLSLPLFSEEVYQDDPILFFGYKVDKFGEVNSPQLVYIDEDKVKWVISENDIVSINDKARHIERKEVAKVYLKNKGVRRKASNE